MLIHPSLKGLPIHQLSNANQLKRHAQFIINAKRETESPIQVPRKLNVMGLYDRFEQIALLKDKIKACGGVIPEHSNIYLT